MIVAAQDQALRTRYIRKVIEKESIEAKRRLCGEKVETVAHNSIVMIVYFLVINSKRYNNNGDVTCS